MEIFNQIFNYLFSDQNKGYAVSGFIGGWVYSIHLLTDGPGLWSFVSIEFFLKGLLGLCYSVIAALAVKIALDTWTIKFKHKIFKNGKEKNDDQRRA